MVCDEFSACFDGCGKFQRSLRTFDYLLRKYNPKLMVKKIAEKRVGTITYELRHFPGDNTFVVNKLDDAVMGVGTVAHRVPTIATFNDEEKALAFFEQVGSEDSQAS